MYIRAFWQLFFNNNLEKLQKFLDTKKMENILQNIDKNNNMIKNKFFLPLELLFDITKAANGQLRKKFEKYLVLCQIWSNFYSYLFC